MNRLTVKYRYDPENQKAKNRVTYFLNGEPIVTLGLGRYYPKNVRLTEGKLAIDLKLYCSSEEIRKVTYPVKKSVLKRYGVSVNDTIYLG